MKTLLLLLLPFVGMCQTKKVVPKEPNEHQMLTMRLSTLFYIYKHDCYADSSEIMVMVNNPKITSLGESRTLEYIIPAYEKKWVHRQPTFEGFMEYVDRISK